MYGPIAITELVTADITAPGAPTIVALSQTDNHFLNLVVALPLADADGSELTGLTKLTIAYAATADGINPFNGLPMVECLAVEGVGVVELGITSEQAGQQVELAVPIVNLGGAMALAIACSD